MNTQLVEKIEKASQTQDLSIVRKCMCLTKTEGGRVRTVACCYQLFHQVQLAEVWCLHIQHSKAELVFYQTFLLLIGLGWAYSQSF